MPEVETVPWSELGPEFVSIWGRANPSDPQPEHMEILGMSGSGKTHFLCTVAQERMIVRETPTTIIATKPADTTLAKLGWPIVTKPRELNKHRYCIFWPQTDQIGTGRKAYQNKLIYDYLSQLWQPEANRIIAFDEIAYAESLSAQMRELIEMYWREGRSQGITMIGMKQRPQGANRHMSSETIWTVAYKPKDQDDMERFAELFGPRRQWMPVIESMSWDRHEFLIKNHRSQQAYISWIDIPLTPISPEEENKMAAYIRGKNE
jgi:hypothetical protein